MKSALGADLEKRRFYRGEKHLDSIWSSVFNLVALLYLLGLKGADDMYEDYNYSFFIARIRKEEI